MDRSKEWKMTKGVPLYFKANTMKNDYKLWYHFLAARLLFTKYFSDMTKDNAILLYVIVSRTSINVGQLVFNSIVQAIHSPYDGLWYPSLITTLCKKVGVIWERSEVILHPKVPLDVGIIRRFYTHGHSTARGSSSLASRHPPLQQHPQHFSMS
ncbi:Uncharacterized protein TCM_022566 [Theobroma cacao]|uniref:Putative plant transposon protein domain-containing protein n=1 Tax=Theobroma cacao TaxID=3641 RepID=A0A061ET73_THECC|nr:Uncharacterized protein TCM_022566 [Theobroma cacao]